MSDQKTERLINLTLALLATKRYLSKSEIFTTVSGYSGSSETMERMFERDKDELRSLGVEIQVRAMDPLFEDEQGYLIPSERFQVKPNQFDRTELLLLTMATNLWHESALKLDSAAALFKIQSLSGPFEANDLKTPIFKDTRDSLNISFIMDSIQRHIALKFAYKGGVRIVEPYGLYTSDGFWYLVARENEIYKSYKLLRIEGEITQMEKNDLLTRDESFSLSDFIEHQQGQIQELATIRIRKQQGLALRNKYSVKEIDDEWDEMIIPYTFEQDIIQSLLWFGSDVYVVAPDSIKAAIINQLKVLADG